MKPRILFVANFAGNHHIAANYLGIDVVEVGRRIHEAMDKALKDGVVMVEMDADGITRVIDKHEIFGHKPDLIICDELVDIHADVVKQVIEVQARTAVQEIVAKHKPFRTGAPQSKGDRHRNKRHRWS